MGCICKLRSQGLQAHITEVQPYHLTYMVTDKGGRLLNAVQATRLHVAPWVCQALRLTHAPTPTPLPVHTRRRLISASSASWIRRRSAAAAATEATGNSIARHAARETRGLQRTRKAEGWGQAGSTGGTGADQDAVPRCAVAAAAALRRPAGKLRAGHCSLRRSGPQKRCTPHWRIKRGLCGPRELTRCALSLGVPHL